MLTPAEFKGVRFWRDDKAAAEGVLVVFSSRGGGVSPAPFDSLNVSDRVGDSPENVAANRLRIASAAGFNAGRLQFVKQVHGDKIIKVEDGFGFPPPEGDGLMTGAGGVVLAIVTADCVPVVVSGERGLCVVHAGWRGLAAGIVQTAVKMTKGHKAWVGPGIGGCCYEVGDDVTGAFERAGLPVLAANRVDPRHAAKAALESAGVENPAVVDECTFCSGHYFSARRKGKTGRQGAFAALLTPGLAG